MYPYQDEGQRLGKVLQRPIAPVSLVGSDVSPGLLALVDSGCSHILAAPWTALSAGVEPRRSDRLLQLGIGGRTVNVRFVDMKVRLLAPDGDDQHYLEWEVDVGFCEQWRAPFGVILGQSGFLDEFTVTMSQYARMTAVQDRDVFDTRFGIPLASSD